MAWRSVCRRASRGCWRPIPVPSPFAAPASIWSATSKSVAVIDPGPDLPEHIAALQARAGRPQRQPYSDHPHPSRSFARRPAAEGNGAARKTYGFGPHARNDRAMWKKAATGISCPMSGARRRVIAGDGFHLECVFTPGHTSNHMCYALAEEKALFTGDHVMGWSTSVIAPPDGNMGDYMRSLEKLIARDDAILYPTHGSPIAKPGPFLRAYLTHRRMREAQIADCLARGRDTVAGHGGAALCRACARAASAPPRLTVRGPSGAYDAKKAASARDGRTLSALIARARVRKA